MRFFGKTTEELEAEGEAARQELIAAKRLLPDPPRRNQRKRKATAAASSKRRKVEEEEVMEIARFMVGTGSGLTEPSSLWRKTPEEAQKSIREQLSASGGLEELVQKAPAWSPLTMPED